MTLCLLTGGASGNRLGKFYSLWPDKNRLGLVGGGGETVDSYSRSCRNSRMSHCVPQKKGQFGDSLSGSGARATKGEPQFGEYMIHPEKAEKGVSSIRSPGSAFFLFLPFCHVKESF